MKSPFSQWILLFFLAVNLVSAPKEEFRAAWVTTVWRSDWPSNNTVATQQSEMRQILDNLQAWNFNAVIFQVRPACDAFYASDIEPWSNWLTGTEGTAPSPLYDPLQFVIDEARSRNLEVHAWFNPYRAKIGSAGTDSRHVFNRKPEWILEIGSKGGEKEVAVHMDETDIPPSKAPSYILDPGKAAVRDYVVSVIADVANRYDIDGVHMDDYFYPYSPQISNEDAATFAEESRGFSDIGDWRRDNVHLLIEAIHNTLQAINPRLKFGMSPFGIWKNGTPSGTTGMDAYNVIYCDAIKWVEEQWIDYLTPQLYWVFDGGQDYGKLLPWWAGYTNDNQRHLYAGHGAYKIASLDWPNNEIPRQIRLNRQTASALGSIFFSYRDVNSNHKSFRDSLEARYFNHPALPPKMEWKDNQAAPAPRNLQQQISGGALTLNWETGDNSGYNDAAWRYIIYKWPKSAFFDPDDPSQIAAFVAASEDLTYSDSDYASYDFGIAALDRLSNESRMVMLPHENDLDLSFESNTDAVNWGNHDEDAVGTSVTWNGTGGTNGSGALNFTDPGWTFLMKRPIQAVRNGYYTLSVDVKTDAWTHSTNTLNLYITGLSSTEPSIAVSSYSSYTRITLSGIADASSSGYIRFYGMNNGNPSSLWIDNLEFRSEVPYSQAGKIIATGAGQTISFPYTNISLEMDVSTGDTIRVQRMENGADLVLFDGTEPQNVSAYRWIIRSGELAFSNGILKINTDELSGIANPATVDIYKRDTPGSGSFSKLATSYANGFLSANITGFSEFILGSNDSDNSLPVSLVYFTAKATKTGILLEWETSAEIENAGFIIRRQEAGPSTSSGTGSQENGTSATLSDRKTEETQGRLPLLEGEGLPASSGQAGGVLASYLTHQSLAGAGSVTKSTQYTFTDSKVEAGKTYIYTLSDVDFGGKETKLAEATLRLRSGSAIVADNYTLMPAYPNPFNSVTTLSYDLPEKSDVTLAIFNIQGQEIHRQQWQNQPAGHHSIQWNGSRHATGVYFVRLSAADFNQTRKMIYLK